MSYNNILMNAHPQTTEVHYSYFDEITYQSNGGAISLREVIFVISHCVFRKCKVDEASNGGAIYLISNECNSSCCHCCETDCYAYDGFFFYYILNNMFMYIDSVSLSFSSCKSKGGIFCDYSSTISSNVNYSNIRPQNHGSFLGQRSYYVDSKYNIFYKNADDVLFYYGSYIELGTIISCSLFVENTYSMNNHGYLHINVSPNQIAYAVNLTFVNNHHYFFDPSQGKIIALNIYCDKWIEKSTNIETDNIIETSSFLYSINPTLIENKCETQYAIIQKVLSDCNHLSFNIFNVIKSLFFILFI